MELAVIDASPTCRTQRRARSLHRLLETLRSHAELDADTAVQDEVRFAARALLDAVKARQAGKSAAPPEISAPREK
jgi:hypothetical protein